MLFETLAEVKRITGIKSHKMCHLRQYKQLSRFDDKTTSTAQQKQTKKTNKHKGLFQKNTKQKHKLEMHLKALSSDCHYDETRTDCDEEDHYIDRNIPP